MRDISVDDIKCNFNFFKTSATVHLGKTDQDIFPVASLLVYLAVRGRTKGEVWNMS